MSTAGGSAVLLTRGPGPRAAMKPFAGCGLGPRTPQELQGLGWTLHYVCTCLFCCCVVS